MIEFTIVAVLIAYCGLLLINRTIQHSRECLARENTSLTLRLDEANAVVVEACDSLEDAFRRESSMREEITRLTVRLNESEELRAKERSEHLKLKEFYSRSNKYLDVDLVGVGEG